MNGRPVPNKLYKYRTSDVFSLRSLTQGEIYYANPTQFNDPLDCNPTIINDTDLTALEILFCELFTRTGSGTIEAAKLEIANHRYGWAGEEGEYELTEDEFKRALAKSMLPFLVAELGKKGVLSLAEKWDCPLTWSHYANEHRGFCIEYDTTALPHENLARVDMEARAALK